MSEMLVRLEKAQDMIIHRLTSAGVFKTKSEAVRAGILQLGKEYHIFETIEEITDPRAIKKMEKIEKEIREGKRKVYSEAEAKKMFGL